MILNKYLYAECYRYNPTRQNGSYCEYKSAEGLRRHILAPYQGWEKKHGVIRFALLVDADGNRTDPITPDGTYTEAQRLQMYEIIGRAKLAQSHYRGKAYPSPCDSSKF